MATTFNYTAITADGKEKKGTLEANDEDAVRSALKAQGLIATSITLPSALDKGISFGGKVKAADLSLFCKQFSSILHAGVTVIQAMDMMKDQASNKNLQEACKNCKILVEKGESLASAMAQYPNVFPDMLIHMVEAGEASGSLETCFERMATQFEKSAKINSMIKQAMVYPIVLLIVVIGVLIVMMVKVVPSFQETFDGVGAQLPLITRIVVSISHSLMHSWWIILLVIAGIVFGIKTFKQTDKGADFFGRLELHLPIFGTLFTKQACANLARTLGTLTASGIPLVNAIDLASKVMSNRVIRVAIKETKEDVERGVPLSQPLEACGLFPPLFYQMVHIGEETGNIEGMLDKCADFYEEEVENATQTISTILEPLIIVLLAGVVVPIIAAVMMPMLSIYSIAENS